MRILYYNYSFREKMGGGTHAREVLNALRELPSVDVESGPRSSQESTGAWGQETPREKLWFLPQTLKEWLRFWIKSYKKEVEEFASEYDHAYDVILFRPNKRLRMIPSIKALCPDAHLCLELNSFVHSECLSRAWPNPLWMRLEANLINRADSIMVVSGYLRDQLIQRGISQDKILVNQNGVNLERFGETAGLQRETSRMQFKLPRDAFVLGYVGGMEPFRRLPLVVNQVLELMRAHSHIHFIMAGDGEARAQIEMLISNAPLNVRVRVRYNGSIPYIEVPAFISAFDCALYPYSNPYGSPQKLFEYMAMGVPVVGPDVPVVREIFRHLEHLVLADQSGKDFCEWVCRMIEDPATRNSLARKGQALIKRYYTWKDNARRLVAFLEHSALEPSPRECD